MSFTDKYNDNGNFTYKEDGFVIKFKSGEQRYVKWSEMDTIIAYKRDEMTTDQICLDLFYQENLSFSISEDIRGWYQFLIRMHQAFPQIKKDWEIDVMHPAFKANTTLLYDKEGRELKDVMEWCYKKETSLFVKFAKFISRAPPAK